MNSKHVAIAAGLTAVAGVVDQLAGTGILQSLGPWGIVAAAVLSAASNAYLHRKV